MYQDVVDEWLSETLPQLLMDYAPEDVFNADETGLFGRLTKPFHLKVINAMQERKIKKGFRY